jgi:hypothetical protein
MIFTVKLLFGCSLFWEISRKGLVNQPFFSYSAITVAKERDRVLFLMTILPN